MSIQDDLKYRFDELITTIRLLPDNPEEAGEVVFPNLTRDLAEPEIYTALLCQTFKEHESDNEEKHEFTVKMIATLSNSAMESMSKKMEADETPNDDDLYALALAVNIAWAIGSADITFKIGGMLAHVTNQYDLEFPDLACLVLKGNKGAERFGKLDPYRILNRDYTPVEMARVTMGDEKADILEEILRNIGDKD